MSSAFFKLNITVNDSSLPVIPAEKVQTFSPPTLTVEADSFDHWNFNTGSLLGRNANTALTAGSVAPNFVDQHLETYIGTGGGLLSTLTDSTEQTICCVIQTAPTGTARTQSVLGGTISSVTTSGGGLLFGATAISSYANPLTINDRPSTVGNLALNLPPDGNWYFIAASQSFSGATNARIIYIGGATPVVATDSPTAEFVPSANKIALGNGYLTQTTTTAYDHQSFAEFILYTRH